MARRLTAKMALDRILNISADSSGDDGESDSDAFSSQSDERSEASDVDDVESEAEQPSFIGKDGTRWMKAGGNDVGRYPAQNVFNGRSGVTSYCRNIETPADAWRLLIDEGCIRHIIECTNDAANATCPGWSCSEEEMEKFIGLLYLRGVMNQRNFPLDLLWSKEMGSAAFSSTMPRDRFRSIKEHLRFDKKSTRQQRLAQDKFCLISFIMNRFVENAMKSYNPEPSMTVDEQLFPTKARCKFTQYMAQKPDKFGIKFWILAEVDSKYCYNIIPYLGKEEGRTAGLATHVVLKLVEPLHGKGYNITTDNFFTNKDLAEELLKRRLSLVGTVRLNRRELPPLQNIGLHDSVFLQSGHIHLTQYKAKANKNVVMLSTLHRGTRRESEGKRKPETVIYYNHNKFGVDMLDSMCRQMSTKSGTRRWPVAVFFNILDIAGINAWILFRKKTGRNVNRRQFLLELSKELRQQRESEEAAESTPVRSLSQRTNCRVKTNCQRNRTVNICVKCDRPVCGSCSVHVCDLCR